MNIIVLPAALGRCITSVVPLLYVSSSLFGTPGNSFRDWHLGQARWWRRNGLARSRIYNRRVRFSSLVEDRLAFFVGNRERALAGGVRLQALTEIGAGGVPSSSQRIPFSGYFSEPWPSSGAEGGLRPTQAKVRAA